MNGRPYHLAANVTSRATYCGIDAHTPEALPLLTARHLDGHQTAADRAGRSFHLCPQCQLRHAEQNQAVTWPQSS